jgi:hypothetical protein
MDISKNSQILLANNKILMIPNTKIKKMGLRNGKEKIITMHVKK